MITFPLAPNARMETIDLVHAFLDSVVIDPASQAVQELVAIDVKKNRYRVPLKLVASAEGDMVRLKISSDQFGTLQPFDAGQLIAHLDEERDFIAAGEMPATIYLMPGIPSENLAGDLQMIRGAYVEASDGPLGSIQEIEVDPVTGQISEIIITTRKKEELSLPVSLIDRIEADTVILKLTSQEIASLPAATMRKGKRRYDLMARVFDDPGRAEAAVSDWKNVFSKQSKHLLAASAIIIRDAQGEITIQETGDMDAKRGGVWGAVGGGLIGLAGGPIGVVVGALAGAGVGGLAAGARDSGISDDFLKRFAEELKPGSSAIVILVNHESVPEITSAMKDLSGVLVQEELTEQMIQKILAEKGG